MDKKEKNDGLRIAGAGAALGAAAGAGASIIPDAMEHPGKKQPKAEKPEEPAQPQPAPHKTPHVEPVKEEPVDVVTDPDNPIDINEVAITIGDIGKPEDIEVVVQPEPMYGPPMPPTPWDGPEPIEDVYGGPIDPVDPWDPDPYVCVYAGPIDPNDIDPIDIDPDIEGYTTDDDLFLDE